VKNGDWVFDYFAGSGTTGHTAITLNREDGARRRFVLVEIGDYFDTVLLPRLKKVTFTPEWKDGKPKRMATAEEAERSPRIIKYHTIESYEDALENIVMPESDTAQTALELYGDDYLLKYVLDVETRGSASLLNIEMFREPFDYKLKRQGENGRQETTVDLVETFNYLLGLDVRKLRQFEDGDRKYRAVLGTDRKGKSVVVVWRPVKDIEENKEALLRDKEFVEKTVLPALLGALGHNPNSEEGIGLCPAARPDRLFVNGASFVENAEAIEPEFKRLMFAPLSY
jgi:adenine-specific DNA-methyltransferase